MNMQSIPPDDLKIGVVGLGRMGSAIARRLASQGFQLSGWTRSGVSPQKATELEITAHSQLTDVVNVADMIILSLIDDVAVNSVVQKLCRGNLKDKLIIDTSTVSPKTLSAHRDAICEAGAAAIDAPISGGPEMVLGGVAGIYMGGEKDHVDQFMPVAQSLSNRIHHVGKLGDGAAAKIVNNMMLAGYWQNLKEAMQVGKRAGLSAEKMLEILSNSPSANGIIAPKIPVILGESDAVSFTVSGIVKDLTLFNETAGQYDVPAPCMRAALASFKSHKDAGNGQEDFASMLRAAYESA